MRRTELAWALGFGLVVTGVSGCKGHPARVPAQPVVRTLPPIKTQPDFPMGSLPPARIDENPSVSPRQDLRRTPAPPSGPSASEMQAALAAVQRRQDATLLQQQQAASRRQQEELDHQVEQNVKAQRQMDAQPRIQEPPERPMTQPPQPQGIQDQLPGPVGPTL